MKFFQDWSKETFQKVFVVVMFTLSALYGTTNYYILRKNGLLVEWKSKIAALHEQIEDAQKMAATAQKESAHRQQVEAFVTTHRQAMITGDPFAWVVREITLIGEKHPLRVQGLRPGMPGQIALKNRYTSYGLEMSLAGTYDQIGVFVANLENHFATGKVKSLTLSGSPSGQHQAILQMELLVVPDAKTLIPAATATPTPPKEAS